MRRFRCFFLLSALFLVGCGKESTDQLLENLKAPDSLTRLKAVRTLPERKGDAARVVPALIEALKDEDEEVRCGAALGLGTFGPEAKSALPALQAVQHDKDPSVRKARRHRPVVHRLELPRPVETAAGAWEITGGILLDGTTRTLFQIRNSFLEILPIRLKEPPQGEAKVEAQCGLPTRPWSRRTARPERRPRCSVSNRLGAPGCVTYRCARWAESRACCSCWGAARFGHNREQSLFSAARNRRRPPRPRKLR